jgi:peptidoglycan/LPS O-acetylase OafA/YrhL
VDGLRALAVLSVLFFHAQLGPFAGGFVGVDVFFVISGFLITGILLREQAQGRFSLAGFYARRARRIGPALLAVSLACIVPAWLLMDARELRAFFRLLASVAVAGSNFVLAATTGYFDGAAEDQPLLHTWSLGVEEQFYGSSRCCWWRWRAGVSPAGSRCWRCWPWARSRWPSRAPSATPTPTSSCPSGGPGSCSRAASRRWSPRVRRRCAALAPGPRGDGPCAIGAAVFWFDRATPSPSLALLLPVAGTVLVLLCADTGTLAAACWRCGRWWASASSPTACTCGTSRCWLSRASRSAHACRRMALGRDRGEPACWRRSPGSSSSKPFRTGRAAASGGRWLFAGAAVAAVPRRRHRRAGRGAHVRHLASGIADAFEPPPRTGQLLRPAAGARAPRSLVRDQRRGRADPELRAVRRQPRLASCWKPRGGGAQRRPQWLFAGFSACPPLLDVVLLYSPDRAQRDCEAMNTQMLAQVRRAGIRDVYLVAKWSYSTEAWSTGFINALGFSRSDPSTVEGSRRAFRHGYEATVRAYAAAGVRLHVVEQVPQQEQEPRALYKRLERQATRSAGAAGGGFRDAGPPSPAAGLRGVGAARARPAAPRAAEFRQRAVRRQALRHRHARPSFLQGRSHLSALGAQRLVTPLVRSLRRPAALDAPAN